MYVYALERKSVTIGIAYRLRRFLVFSFAFAARFSFFMRGSTTLNRPFTPAGRRTRLLARCLRVTTYETSSFLSCAFLYSLRILQ